MRWSVEAKPQMVPFMRSCTAAPTTQWLTCNPCSMALRLVARKVRQSASTIWAKLSVAPRQLPKTHMLLFGIGAPGSCVTFIPPCHSADQTVRRFQFRTLGGSLALRKMHLGILSDLCTTLAQVRSFV